MTWAPLQSCRCCAGFLTAEFLWLGEICGSLVMCCEKDIIGQQMDNCTNIWKWYKQQTHVKASAKLSWHQWDEVQMKGCFGSRLLQMLSWDRRCSGKMIPGETSSRYWCVRTLDISPKPHHGAATAPFLRPSLCFHLVCGLRAGAPDWVRCCVCVKKKKQSQISLT